ncbi:hypothetical protein Hanom_Chr04g00321761 [Helianthus anomalus]
MLCEDINRIRTMSPLAFWTKDMLSRREKFEIKSGSFGKGELREGYIKTQDFNDVDEMVIDDRGKNVGDRGGEGLGK